MFVKIYHSQTLDFVAKNPCSSLTCVISCDFCSAQSTPIPTDARFKQVHKPNPAQSTPNPVYFRDTRTTNKQLNIVQLVNFSLVRI
jgi:hypothetical protein